MEPALAEISDGDTRRTWMKSILGRVKASRVAREGLEQMVRVVQAPRRCVLARPGKPGDMLFLLGQGRVRVERVGSLLTRVALEHAGPGDLLGDVATDSGFMESWTVMDAVTALALPRRELQEFCAREAAVHQLMARLAHQRLRQAQGRLQSLMSHEVDARLATFLLSAMDRWGCTVETGVRLDASFRHHELAEMVGARREWVTVTLIELRRRGIVGAEGRRIVVLDVDALVALAEGR